MREDTVLLALSRTVSQRYTEAVSQVEAETAEGKKESEREQTRGRQAEFRKRIQRLSRPDWASPHTSR